MRAQPLVTVTGVGGTGKTRLALKTAEKALAFFPDGVWLVELAPLADRELVPQAVVIVIGLAESHSLTLLQNLIEFLRPRQVLILLDNCEHVIGAAAGLAHELLRACPRLHILATSREILGAEGETAFRCPSLALPDAKQSLPAAELSKTEALRLFVERAQGVSPGFTLTETNAATAVRICRRLDGIPLAIELAAARLRLLSLEQIAARLDDTFRLLTGGSRTDLPRHQTLKALIDWSYNLLSEKEKLLLLRLSVFAGGWTVEAAEAICADEALLKDEILDLLGQLLDKSLAGMESGTKSGQPRYRMLETIRQYAHDRSLESGGGAMVRERHLDYYLDLSLRAEVELIGINLRWWRDLLDEEIDNLRLAVEWSLAGGVEKGMRMALALTWFLQNRHPIDGIEWLRRLLASESDDEPELREKTERRAARGKALTALPLIANGTIDQVSLVQEAMMIFERLGPDYELDWALALSILSAKDPRPLELFRRAGDRFGITEALWPLMVESLGSGNLIQARIYAEESLALNHQIGYLSGESTLLSVMAWLALMDGEIYQAEEFVNAGQVCEQNAGDTSGCVTGFLSGWIGLSTGDYPRARHIFEELLATAQTSDDHSFIAWNLGFLARIAAVNGNLELAEKYCQEAERLTEYVYDGFLTSALYSHILVSIYRRDYGLAFERLKHLSGHWYGQGNLPPIQLLIQAFGILAAAQDRHQRAAVLFGAQDFIARQLMNISTPREREDYQQALAATRAGLGEDGFARAMDQGRALSLEEAIQYAVEDSE